MSIYETYQDYLMPYAAEMACSFAFGFIVYAATISQAQTLSAAGPVIVGIAIGFGSIALIYMFCDMTLAHFNLAITFSAIVFGHVSIIRGLFFIVAQLCGFMIASAAALGCFSGSSYTLLNIMRPKRAFDEVNAGNIICMEAILTGILVFVAFSVAINTFHEPDLDEETLRMKGRERRPDRRITQPLVIGLTLGFLAFLGAASSGGAFNPGLVFAPVIFAWEWINSWAYWVGQFGGGLIGAGIQSFLLKRVS